jgi:hypothetical protein
VPGVQNRLLALAPRRMPRSVTTRLVRQAQERVGH